MKLVVKFNIVLLLVFLIGLAIASYIARSLFQANARDEILQNARIMMEAALATRSYTQTQVAPLLETQMKYTFLPQSVPAFAATEYFNALRQKYPEYSYKEATLNPTNPRNRATDWEHDVVGRFRDAPEQPELIGERDTPTGRSLYIARPIQIKNGACLRCHSTVDAAPKTMIDRYGPANGFGWKLNEVVGAQILSVPAEVPLARAERAFNYFLWSLVAVFAFIFVVLNLMLYAIVIRPVTRLSAIADRVSLGELDAPEFKHGGRDEIGKLVASFGRLRKSLTKAMTMLDE